jgi:hypothetical protein
LGHSIGQLVQIIIIRILEPATIKRELQRIIKLSHNEFIHKSDQRVSGTYEYVTSCHIEPFNRPLLPKQQSSKKFFAMIEILNQFILPKFVNNTTSFKKLHSIIQADSRSTFIRNFLISQNHINMKIGS